jgi:hypothetical protein
MSSIQSSAQLTDSQRQALAVLTEGGTSEQAAKAAGVSERTVYRWRSNPAFAAALLSADPHSLQTIFTDVLRVGGKSIMLLEKIIDGQGKEFPLSAKLRASAIILQHLGGLYQLVGLEAQIAEVKAQLEALQAMKGMNS